jgi:hypothetical protein
VFFAACSSNGGSTSGNGGAGGGASGGAGAGGSSTGGSPGAGGATGAGGGGPSAGGSTGSGGTTGAGGGGGGARDGGMGGSGGATGTGGTSGVPAASTLSCTLLLGIDSTSEWFGASTSAGASGFESGEANSGSWSVDTSKWEIIFHHPGYVADWTDLTDAVWSTAVSSACTMNSTNPDRVIFNGFADPSLTTYMNVTDWVTGLNKVIQNIKTKYSRVRRIDLLTMTRGPNNMACMTGNNDVVVADYVDTAMAMVAAANPTLVTTSPKFYAPDCTVFMSGGPHFTSAGAQMMAKTYGNYYSTEP